MNVLGNMGCIVFNVVLLIMDFFVYNKFKFIVWHKDCLLICIWHLSCMLSGHWLIFCNFVDFISKSSFVRCFFVVIHDIMIFWVLFYILSDLLFNMSSPFN